MDLNYLISSRAWRQRRMPFLKGTLLNERPRELVSSIRLILSRQREDVKKGRWCIDNIVFWEENAVEENVLCTMAAPGGLSRHAFVCRGRAGRLITCGRARKALVCRGVALPYIRYTGALPPLKNIIWSVTLAINICTWLGFKKKGVQSLTNPQFSFEEHVNETVEHNGGSEPGCSQPLKMFAWRRLHNKKEDMAGKVYPAKHVLFPATSTSLMCIK